MYCTCKMIFWPCIAFVVFQDMLTMYYIYLSNQAVPHFLGRMLQFEENAIKTYSCNSPSTVPYLSWYLWLFSRKVHGLNISLQTRVLCNAFNGFPGSRHPAVNHLIHLCYFTAASRWQLICHFWAKSTLAPGEKKNKQILTDIIDAADI